MFTNEMEIITFAVRECYIYAPLPPADSSGYRAQSWDVDNWAKEVSLKVVTVQDELIIKLLDKETNELFAECPVDNAKPIQTSVEPVLDSSRYYVLRIVDAESRKHAFIGIGFRERHESTDFMAALSDHRQYLERKQRAEKTRNDYTTHPENHRNYSLKPGEKIKIQLPKGHRDRSEEKKNSVLGDATLVRTQESSADDEWGDFISS